jgi:hypothetical protein
LYVTGTSLGDYGTIKYDAYGNQLWVARYNDNDPLGDDAALAIAVDRAANVYDTGSICDYAVCDEVSCFCDTVSATIKYDTDGNQLWVARFPGPDSADYTGAYAIVLDAVGNVYVTGRVSATLSP